MSTLLLALHQCVSACILKPDRGKSSNRCKLSKQQLQALFPAERADDDDELMLNVLRCHETY